MQSSIGNAVKEINKIIEKLKDFIANYGTSDDRFRSLDSHWIRVIDEEATEEKNVQGSLILNNSRAALDLQYITWRVVMQMLEKLSRVKGFEEATDTAVRDEVWFALSRRLNNAS